MSKHTIQNHNSSSWYECFLLKVRFTHSPLLSLCNGWLVRTCPAIGLLAAWSAAAPLPFSSTVVWPCGITGPTATPLDPFFWSNWYCAAATAAAACCCFCSVSAAWASTLASAAAGAISGCGCVGCFKPTHFSISWRSPLDLGLDAVSTETLGGDGMPSAVDIFSPNTSSCGEEENDRANRHYTAGACTYDACWFFRFSPPPCRNQVLTTSLPLVSFLLTPSPSVKTSYEYPLLRYDPSEPIGSRCGNSYFSCIVFFTFGACRKVYDSRFFFFNLAI